MLLLGNMEVDYKYFWKESNEFAEFSTHDRIVCLNNKQVKKLFNAFGQLTFWAVQHNWMKVI